MKSASTAPTALLLIDIQRGFDHPTYWGGARNNPSFEHNITQLLAAARSSSGSKLPCPVLIIHIHHLSEQPGSMLHPDATIEIISPSSSSASSTPITIRAIEPQPYATPLPHEPILTKHVNSSFIGTTLEPVLRSNGIRQLVIAGLTTDHCVSTTTRMAANLKVLGDDGGVDGSGPDGHGVLLVGDATATFPKGGVDAETLQRAHLASLDGEFCEVVSARDVVEGVFGRR